jgi:hypothetical protein
MREWCALHAIAGAAATIAIAKSAKHLYIRAIRDLACLAVSASKPLSRTRKIRIEDRANGSYGRKTHDAFQKEGHDGSRYR